MTSRYEEEPSREIEPKPKLGLTFVGWAHDPYDAQGMRLLGQELKLFSESTSGERIILLESAASDTREAEQTRKQIKTLGVNFVIHHVLTQELERAPSSREVENRRGAIEDIGIPLAVRRGLLPFGWGSSYFFLSLLERLGGVNEFNIEIESHVPRVAENIKQVINERADLHPKALEALRNGNFEEGEELLKRIYKSRAEIVRIRDLDIAEILKEKIKKLRKKKEGGAVFMAFGGGHKTIPSLLERKLPGTPIEFRTIVMEEELIDPEDDDGAFRIHADEVLTLKLRSSLPEDKLLDFSNNYAEIRSVIRGIVLGMEPEEIRSIVSGKEDPLEILRDHVGNHTVVLLSKVLQEQDGD